MKVGLVCTRGGHLDEMERLLPAVSSHDHFWVIHSEPVPRHRADAYRIGELPRPPLSYLRVMPRVVRVLRSESPDVLLSTGSQVAIPFFVAARLFGIHTIFVESVCRTDTLSVTGRILRHVADDFYVQWPDLADELGETATYEGSVL